MLATGLGQCLLIRPKLEDDWESVSNANAASMSQSMMINPITCLGVMGQGLPMFVVGYASGAVKLFMCETGQLVCEIGAHSRQVNALCCHPNRTVFATAGDDTFVNLWEVSGSSVERLDINVLTSSIVNDY